MSKQLMTLPQRVLDDAKKAARKKGHAGVPGRGPDGETCGTCKHRASLRLTRRHHKCKLMEKTWGRGPKTDIKLGDPACDLWEKSDD